MPRAKRTRETWRAAILGAFLGASLPQAHAEAPRVDPASGARLGGTSTLLRSPYVRDRLHAAEAITPMTARDELDWLLTDPAPEVRKVAARRIAAAFPDGRVLLLTHLAAHPLSDPATVLPETLLTSDAEVRSVLGLVGSKPDTRSQDAIRGALVRAGDLAAESCVAGALRGELAATHAVSLCPDQRQLMAAVVAALDGDLAAAPAALPLAAALGDASLADSLLRLVRGGSTPRVRARAVDAFGSYPTDLARVAIEVALEDHDALVRNQAVRTALRMELAAVAPHLVDMYVRAAADRADLARAIAGLLPADECDVLWSSYDGAPLDLQRVLLILAANSTSTSAAELVERAATSGAVKQDQANHSQAKHGQMSHASMR